LAALTRGNAHSLLLRVLAVQFLGDAVLQVIISRYLQDVIGCHEPILSVRHRTRSPSCLDLDLTRIM